jgi:hypothetical protein
MVAAVAKARDLINRQTASSVCQEELDADAFSVLTHVSRLSSKWNLVGYTIDVGQIRTELASRGPVIAAIPVRQSLLTHVSSIIGGESTVYTPGDDAEMGMVAVAILGWRDDAWLVALPWGKFSKPEWDGCVYVPATMPVNACGMCKPSGVQATETSFVVNVMPDAWTPPTTRPLPTTMGSRTSGKVKHLKSKTKREHHPLRTLCDKLTDENITTGLKCVVTTTMIILAIMVVVILKTRKH